MKCLAHSGTAHLTDPGMPPTFLIDSRKVRVVVSKQGGTQMFEDAWETVAVLAVACLVVSTFGDRRLDAF